ncbi:lysosomal acid glucosylceramidase-like isoform X1 [Gallus gallus]|uniref:lysosomal acid glucosylceramidase-like isoform X1 n=1 Tax=Gallus gallus TaxID=9031 RepID=UPI001AE5F6A3|nr:lysosomal acid glucosylceramidase-like isoform X1 [Gallus gallus]
MGGRGAAVLCWLLLLRALRGAAGARPCSPKFFGRDAMVCVCSAAYCDAVEPVVLPGAGGFVTYESSKAGKRLQRSEGDLPAQPECPGWWDGHGVGWPWGWLAMGWDGSEGTFRHSLSAPDVLLTLDVSARFQRLKGFGGSLSDAAALNIVALPQPAQEELLRSYFSDSGIEYNLIRVPMGCSDFSTRPYSYDDVPDDFELRHFALAEEDLEMKIPLLRRAIAMAKRPLSIYGSPWTAPAWMKSNGDIRGKGTLKGRAGGKYHRAWANYFVRFLDEYAKHNITFWAVTAQNEPIAALFAHPLFPTVAFTAEQQRDFVVRDLGPVLQRSPHSARLLIMDDQRIHLPGWARAVRPRVPLRPQWAPVERGG